MGAATAEFRRLLVPWAEHVRRDLPWRQTRDPWAILVAEVMLQQTQVSRVAPRWHAFLGAFPTADACADAEQASVVRAWEGLGYHRRAVLLHRAARAIRDSHGGAVPRDRDALLAIAGIGPYTARAVRAFAFELDDAVLDTNVARVIARAVNGARCTPKVAQARADALVPPGAGWAWNQGMLDLGALVCTKSSPKCDVCPVASACAWRAAGNHSPDPALGSAAVSGTQSRFEGSDRQGRGRVLAALRKGPVTRHELGRLTGWDDELRQRRAVDGLVADGIASRAHDGTIHLC